MNRFDAIAFDLDGTLIDSAGGVAHALNAALAAEGLPGFDLATVRSWIGDGPDALISRALATPQLSAVDTYQLAAHLRRGFDAATLAAPMAGSAVFPDIHRVVLRLAAQLPLVVVTNKPTTLACAVLEEAGLLPSFVAVHGADSAAQRKPSPLLICQAAVRLGKEPQRMLMVGDAASDIGAALAAGSQAAWAGWGYGQPPGAAPPAVWRLATPQDLLHRLAQPLDASTPH